MNDELVFARLSTGVVFIAQSTLSTVLARSHVEPAAVSRGQVGSEYSGVLSHWRVLGSSDERR